MSLRRWDIDGDGHDDLLYSDRKGDSRGVGWLRSRPDSSGRAWHDFEISDRMHEYMFLDVTRTEDGAPLIAAQTRNSGILMYRPGSELTGRWSQQVVTIDPRTGTGKGVAIGDVDLDGELDLVASCENAKNKIGVYWLESAVRSTTDSDLSLQPFSPPLHDISGTESGVKFDRIELADLDGDGDLDVLTCEERDNLGVIWYENPVKQ